MRHNLVAQPTRLIGREHDSAAILESLVHDGVRLLTLTGPAGAGKTRLALEVARAALDPFPDGVYAVDLAHTEDPSQMLSRIAGALRVRDPGDQPLLELLQSELSGRRLLMVLDNFEQVLPAATDVAALLAVVPALTVLVTSRAALHLRWEHEYPVAPLALPPANASANLQRLASCPSVALFVERARAVHPRFQLNPENANAIALICTRLDGLPLAIELAAARCKVFTPEELLPRLERSLDLLEMPRSDVPERQRSLRGAVGWSFQLLGADEQRLFCRLAIFCGGCTLDAIQAVSSPMTAAGRADDITDMTLLNGITSLVDNSLLVRTQTPGAGTRFHLLETIRSFALELLQEGGEEETIRAGHAGFFVTLAERAEPELHGSKSVEWHDRVIVDMDNMRAAGAWLATQSGGVDRGLRLASSLMPVFLHHGLLSEGRAWLERALDAVPSDGSVDQSVFARALYSAGKTAEHQGDYASARQRFTRSAQLFRQLGDRELLAMSLAWGSVMTTDHDLEGPIRSELEESLAIYRENDDQAGIARVLNFLGEDARMRGDYASAAAFYEESMALIQGANCGSIMSRATVLHNLGYVAQRRGHHRQAIALFTEALALYVEATYPRLLAVCIGGLAGAAVAEQPERSVRLLSAVETQLARMGAGMQPADRTEHIRNVAAAQASMDVHVFDDAWSSGTLLTLDDAVIGARDLSALVLGPSRSIGHEGETGPAVVDTLSTVSPREREVATLIAQGLTNREIALRLVISSRTADTHVSNILNKLGFSSRSQVASWAAAQGLLQPSHV